MFVTNGRIDHIAVTRQYRFTRASRIRHIALQVQAGEYRVDAGRLAEVLLERGLFNQRVREELLADRRVEA
jgi:hypothetical protein